MYIGFYGLENKPFMVVPNTAFLFLGREHKEAFDHLLFGIQAQEGFIVVTGEVGTGKTTLGRALLDNLDEKVRTALIINPILTETELLKAIAEDLGLKDLGNTKKEVLDRLHAYLLKEAEEGHTVAVVIDEAQSLPPEVMEGLRLLSNLETETEKLIQIVLLGQPELKGKLALPALRQLNQRISIRYHLKPLSKEEMKKYIYHRLMVAGSQGSIRFTREALRRIYRYSKGIPRLINLVCDKALLAGYVVQSFTIKGSMITKAIQSLQGEEARWSLLRIRPMTFVFAMVLGLVLFMSSYQENLKGFLFYLIEGRIAGSKPIKADTEGSRNISPKVSVRVGRQIYPSEVEIKSEPPVNRQEESQMVHMEFPYFDSDGIVRGIASSDGAKEGLVSLLALWGFNQEELLKRMAKWDHEDRAFDFKEKALEFGLDILFIEGSLERIERVGYPCIIEVQRYMNLPKRYQTLLHISEKEVVIGDHIQGKKVYTREGFQDQGWLKAAVLWKDFDGFVAPLYITMRGEGVTILQQRLKEAGFFMDFGPTGYFGPYTKKVVMDFQRIHKLEEDGVVGSFTKAVLYRKLFGKDLPSLQELSD